jgi:HK97 family phage major capsid protein
LEISTSFETPTGAAGDFPIDDDVLSGRVVAESGAATETDTTFGSLPLVKCPKHGSEMLRVPLELLEDCFTTFDALISPVLSRRPARSVAATAVTRLLADADVAVTAASTTAAVPSEILDLMAAVDPAHSRVEVFLMNKATLTTLRRYTAYTAGYFPNMIGTDSQGRETIFGKPVYSSPFMPALEAGAKSIAFGNFKRFYVRTVAGSLVLQRYDERYAEFAQVGFQMFWRVQAAMAKSTNNPVPVRLLACHS